MEFWEITKQVISIPVTFTTALMAFLAVGVLGWRRNNLECRLMFFVLMPFVVFETAALLHWDILITTGMSRYMRELLYLALLYFSYRTWKNHYGS